MEHAEVVAASLGFLLLLLLLLAFRLALLAAAGVACASAVKVRRVACTSTTGRRITRFRDQPFDKSKSMMIGEVKNSSPDWQVLDSIEMISQHRPPV